MNAAQAAARAVWESLPAKPSLPNPDQVRAWALRFCRGTRTTEGIRSPSSPVSA